MCEVLPPLHEEDVSSPNSNEQPPISNGNYRRSDSDAGGRLTLLTGPPFVEAELLQPLFKDARKELVDLCNQVHF